MSSRSWLLAGCLALGACDTGDVYRTFGVSQGTLVAGLGMPMAEVRRRSSLKLHELPGLGTATHTYADGNACFDFELAGGSLRFKGCSMYSIDAEGADQAVTHINVFVTSGRLGWRAFGEELRGTARLLRDAGFEPQLHPGWQPLEAFLARDPKGLGEEPDVVAAFEWRKGDALFRLSAHRAWDEQRFWSSFDLTSVDFWEPPQERWLGEFRPYPGAREVCSQHALGAPGSQPREIAWTQYTTPDELSAVVAFYAREGGKLSADGDPRLEISSDDGKRRLRVGAVSGSYSSCGKELPRDARTVLVLSQALP